MPPIVFAARLASIRPGRPNSQVRLYSRFVRSRFLTGAVRRVQRSQARLERKGLIFNALFNWGPKDQVTRSGEYRPGERHFGLMSRRGSPQPDGHILWKQREFPAVSGRGETVSKGEWRTKKDSNFESRGTGCVIGYLRTRRSSRSPSAYLT